MKRAQTLFRAGDHRWLVLARDPARPHHVIDTNEYVVLAGDQALLTDPGGQTIFPAVFSALAAEIDPARVTTIFSSHQDPDVISSLALWLEVNPAIKCHTSWLWCEFIPHFSGQPGTLVPIPDEGRDLVIGDRKLQCVPAHFLHSSGNFHLYDPTARILFSGDVGAALLPPDHTDLFVRDFDRHIAHAAGFHRRWMGSAVAKRDWCERAAALAIDMLCPQHGAIYRGADVARFIQWFDDLEIGVMRPPARADRAA